MFSTVHYLANQVHDASAGKTVRHAVNCVLRCDVTFLGEVGWPGPRGTGSDFIFQPVARAYEKPSSVATSSLDFNHSGDLCNKPATAASVLDRL